MAIISKFSNSKWLPIIGLILILALSFTLRSVKAGYFSFSHDEQYVLWSSVSLEKAVQMSASDNVPPFSNVLAAVVNSVFGASPFVQRLPYILFGVGAVWLFYAILKYFRYRNPLLLALVPATSFMLVFYSQELRPYSPYLLLILASFYLGWRLVVAQDLSNAGALLTGLIWGLLPVVQYFAVYHLVALTATLFIALLIWNRKQFWRGILNLILASAIIIIFLIPWANIVHKVITYDATASMGQALIYRLNLPLLQSLLYKLSGGADLWGIVWLVSFVASAIYLIYRFAREREKSEPIDRFVMFLLMYTVIFLVGFSALKFWRMLYVRYFLFLIWPWWLVIFYGISRFMFESKTRTLPVIGIILVGAIVVVNLVNTTVYLRADNRFVDYRAAARIVDEQLVAGKTNLLINGDNNAARDLRFYLSNPDQPIESVEGDFRQRFLAMRDSGIYVHFSTSTPTREVIAAAQTAFASQIEVGRDKNLEWLNRRKVSPYWGAPQVYSGFSPIIVFY